MYPIEKYKFYNAGNKVIAVSTYGGRTIRGVAKCSSEDTFSLEKGKQLAAARCEQKVAVKRLKRAQHKLNEAIRAERQAIDHAEKMEKYHDDALVQRLQVEEYISLLLETL